MPCLMRWWRVPGSWSKQHQRRSTSGGGCRVEQHSDNQRMFSGIQQQDKLSMFYPRGARNALVRQPCAVAREGKDANIMWSRRRFASEYPAQRRCRYLCVCSSVGHCFALKFSVLHSISFKSSRFYYASHVLTALYYPALNLALSMLPFV